MGNQPLMSLVLKGIALAMGVAFFLVLFFPTLGLMATRFTCSSQPVLDGQSRVQVSKDGSTPPRLRN